MEGGAGQQRWRHEGGRQSDQRLVRRAEQGGQGGAPTTAEPPTRQRAPRRAQAGQRGRERRSGRGAASRSRYTAREQKAQGRCEQSTRSNTAPPPSERRHPTPPGPQSQRSSRWLAAQQKPVRCTRARPCQRFAPIAWSLPDVLGLWSRLSTLAVVEKVGGRSSSQLCSPLSSPLHLGCPFCCARVSAAPPCSFTAPLHCTGRLCILTCSTASPVALILPLSLSLPLPLPLPLPLLAVGDAPSRMRIAVGAAALLTRSSSTSVERLGRSDGEGQTPRVLQPEQSPRRAPSPHHLTTPPHTSPHLTSHMWWTRRRSTMREVMGNCWRSR